jgi:hypothetical protein
VLRKLIQGVLVISSLVCAASAPLAQQCPPGVPLQGAALRGAAPLFPATNWWNLDISGAPVDPASPGFISFINNGGTRKLHPDFGGEASPGSVNIYGMPYAVVDGNATAKQTVTFDYWDESDGVNMSTGAGSAVLSNPGTSGHAGALGRRGARRATSINAARPIAIC